MKVLILGSGRIENYLALDKYLENIDYVICADGGVSHGRKFGIKPDLIIGDLDSAAREDIQFFKEIGVPFEKHPVEKDKTDMEISLEKAAERSKDVVILGGSGGRADHYFGNAMMLAAYVDKGMDLLMADEHNEIRVLSDLHRKEMEISGGGSEFLSLIPLTKTVKAVTTKGLKYELINHDLQFGSTFSISNAFVEKTAKVSLEEGKMLVIKSKDMA